MAEPNAIRQAMNSQEFETLKGFTDRAFKNVRSREIWSTFHLHALTGGQIDPATSILAAGDYTLFTAASGKNGQGLPSGQLMTDLDTNFPGESRVGDDQNFAIWELGVSVLPSRQQIVALDEAAPRVMVNGPPSPLDVDQLLSGVLVIKYIDVEIPLGPLSVFQQPGGPFVAVPTLLDFTQAGVAITSPSVAEVGGLGEGRATPTWESRVAKLSANSGNIAPAPATRRKLQVPIFLPRTVNFSFVLRFPRATQLLTAAQGGTNGFRVRLDWWAVESFRDQS